MLCDVTSWGGSRFTHAAKMWRMRRGRLSDFQCQGATVPRPSLRAKRSNPAFFAAAGKLDCFVAVALLAMKRGKKRRVIQQPLSDLAVGILRLRIRLCNRRREAVLECIVTVPIARRPNVRAST